MSQSQQDLSALWKPLRASTFRNLLIADVASDVGTFMQSVGAVWMMVSLNAGPFYIALIQTASTLPFFILALPAGTLGDIVDRKKLILLAELWMLTIAIRSQWLFILSSCGCRWPMHWPPSHQHQLLVLAPDAQH